MNLWIYRDILPYCHINPNFFVMKIFITLLLLISASACSIKMEEEQNLKLWYDEPAQSWNEALPIGNGRMGAMVFGGVEKERIQFNEETLWTGQPHDYANEDAHEYLDEIRDLLFEGKQKEAEELAMENFMSEPLRQKAYQPFGDVYLEFENHSEFTEYRRELNLNKAICTTSYKIGETQFYREVFASYPDSIIVINLVTEGPMKLNFKAAFDSPHDLKSIAIEDEQLTLNVEVLDGGMLGKSRIIIDTDGEKRFHDDGIIVSDAQSATILLNASTNFIDFDRLAKAPSKHGFAHVHNMSYNTLKERHVTDHANLYNRFSLNLGKNQRDTIPTDIRIQEFRDMPDPELVALYVQYGRYLLISSSRPGTYPANLQGIWNHQLKPSWDSKYTVNINTEMNYWPAELTNLSECHEPLFKMIEECRETGVRWS